MNKKILLLTPIAILFAALSTGLCAAEINLSESNTQGSIAKAAPALVSALSDGTDKACIPTHLTLSGKAKDGSRLYVSALVLDFASELRKSAKGSAKMTPAQSHEVQRVLDYAMSAQKNAQGFPLEILERAERESGLKINATLICMTREIVGSKTSDR